MLTLGDMYYLSLQILEQYNHTLDAFCFPALTWGIILLLRPNHIPLDSLINNMLHKYRLL